MSIRTNHDREFDNEGQFGEFCNANGITHNFLAPRTPQSNGVVERKNKKLQEMSRTMLNEQSLPQKFWCNAVMATSTISILSDSSEESVGSHAPRVILFGAILVIIPVIPEVLIVPADPLVALDVGTVSVISPTGVLDLLDYSSSSDSDLSKDSLPHIPDLALVSPSGSLSHDTFTPSP
ncbi:retrovirus-related pol polyprotein from transposon TNT 1-94 [Tanacetum coccineum]